MNNAQQSYIEKLLEEYGVPAAKTREKKRRTLWVALFLTVSCLLVVLFFVIRQTIMRQASANQYPSPIPYAVTAYAPQGTPYLKAATTQPTVDPSTVQRSFKEMVEKNPDTVGYISIPNTLVQYPVVQAADNEYYLDKDFYRKPHDGGTIFMDFRNDICEIDQPNNFILYGHHMKNDSMFATLTYYYSNRFFQNNPIIEFNTIYGDYKWEVFTAYPTNVDFYYIETYFPSPQSYEDFLLVCKDKSKHHNNVMPTAEDTILTLSTCFYNGEGERFVVQARLIESE